MVTFLQPPSPGQFVLSSPRLLGCSRVASPCNRASRHAIASRRLTPTSSNVSLLTLYSTPRSNFSARARYIARRKQLPSSLFRVELPGVLGSDAGPPALAGVRGDKFLSYNPLGRVPLLIVRHTDGKETSLFESIVICEYLIDKFDNYAPLFIAPCAESRAMTRLVSTLQDNYVSPYNISMYGGRSSGDRDAKVEKMKKGFDAIEHALHPIGPYAAGDCVTLGDACLWGNWPFYEYMLPTFFGWRATDGRPKLARWRMAMADESDAARETFTEVWKGCDKWWDSDHWRSHVGIEPLTDRPLLDL